MPRDEVEGARSAGRCAAMRRCRGFTPFTFAYADMTHSVFHAGSAGNPPLLLMPEIAGVSPGLVLFANRLVDAGYQIYVPWLFGPLGERAPVRNALKLCISREFANLSCGCLRR